MGSTLVSELNAKEPAKDRLGTTAILGLYVASTGVKCNGNWIRASLKNQRPKYMMVGERPARGGSRAGREAC